MDTLSSESNIGIVESAGQCKALTPELTFERGVAERAISEIEQKDGTGNPEQAMRVADPAQRRASSLSTTVIASDVILLYQSIPFLREQHLRVLLVLE